MNAFRILRKSDPGRHKRASRPPGRCVQSSKAALITKGPVATISNVPRQTRARLLIGMQLLCGIGATLLVAEFPAAHSSRFIWDHGAIIRGDPSQKNIALVFTGDAYGEGTAPILDTLRQLHLRAGFFVTGDYLRKSKQRELLRRALREGHYVGPHSDRHLLYCSWEDREQSLVTEQQFKQDLQKNLADLKALGATPGLFIPPYEWFNNDQTRWTKEMGIQMFNFSPGSGSNRDYIREGERGFVPSQVILQGILDYEKKDPHGLNGYILLLHLGARREDKVFLQLKPLIRELQQRGYQFVRIDRMLQEQRLN